MTYGGLTLEQLATLESAATPGPWRAQNEYDGARTVCQMRSCDQLVCINRATHVEGNTWEATQQNAALIAAARNALPELLAHIEELERIRELLICKLRAIDEGGKG